MYKTTTEQAKEARLILKDNGYSRKQVSVRNRNGSIQVTIKDLNVGVKKVESLVKGFEDISRCEAAGEILCGGNTFVFVNYDWQVMRDKQEGYTEQAENILANLSPTSHTVAEEGLYILTYNEEDGINILKRPKDYKEQKCYCLDNVNRWPNRSGVDALKNALMYFYMAVEQNKESV